MISLESKTRVTKFLMEKHEGLPRLAAVISLRSQSVPADVKPRILTTAVNMKRNTSVSLVQGEEAVARKQW